MEQGWDAASVLAALRKIHGELYDEAVHLDALAPGVTPTLDLSGLSLHSVRESLLGAHLDLSDGQIDRAIATIWAVLDQQFLEVGHPWSGTFKVVAESAPPGVAAQEWLDYDPNWRQFIGVLLALCLQRFEDRLPADLVDAMDRAIVLAVDGEPLDRIPEWYTNISLLHAWLSAWAGIRADRVDLLEQSLDRVARIYDRYLEFQDFDEYNSPTYDGIDLFALTLWRSVSPTPQFAETGWLLQQMLAKRMNELFHPRLGVVCGPYLRAYGVSLRDYVALNGLWFVLLGVHQQTLPEVLDATTDHIHDLYFAEIFLWLSQIDSIPLRRLDVEREMVRVQDFGVTVATSLLTPWSALGVEEGRIPAFAKDQYVPVVLQYAQQDGRAASIGLKLGEGVMSIDGVIEDAEHLEISVTGNGKEGFVEVTGSNALRACPEGLTDDSVTFLISGTQSVIPEWTEEGLKNDATLRLHFHDLPTTFSIELQELGWEQ